MNAPEKILSGLDWKFRHIRYVGKNEKFIKVRRKLRSYNELMRFLSRQGYRDAYYSVAKFINPHKIGAKSRKNAHGDLFLGMDLFFDIDFDDKSMEENISRAMRETKKITEYGKKKRWRRKYIAFSGSKGFHVCYDDSFKYRKERPWERENEAMEKRKRLVKKMEGIKFDTKITVDSRRIVRVPGTYNSKTGYRCTIIPEEWLEMDAGYILKNVDRNIFWGKRSPLRRAMTLLRNCAKTSGKGFLPNLSQKISYIAGITSNYGKMHIIFLELGNLKRAREEFSERKIPYLILEAPTGKKFIFSPMAVQRNWLGKLSKKIDSPSATTLEKYNHTTIKYQFLSKDMKEIGRLKAVEENVFSPEEGHGTEKKISKMHAELFPETKCLGKERENERGLHYVLLEYDAEHGAERIPP